MSSQIVQVSIMCWPKSCALPHQSHMVNPTHCEQYQQAFMDCYQQQSERGQGACYRCGKLKVKCSLKDVSERPQADAKAESSNEAKSRADGEAKANEEVDKVEGIYCNSHK